MDVDDLFDWLRWGVLVFVFVAMVLAVVALIVILIAETICHLRRRRHSKSTDQMLASIPDVPYKEPPPGGGGSGSGGGATADEGKDECVICQAAYKVDERCFVLPRCKHMFHKACIAAWLRKQVTCPLCRAMVILPAPVKKQSKQLNAPQNMV